MRSDAKYVEEYKIPGQPEKSASKEIANLLQQMKPDTVLYGQAKPKRIVLRARIIND